MNESKALIVSLSSVYGAKLLDNNSNIAEAEKKKVFDHLNIKDQEHQIQIEKLLTEVDSLAFRSPVFRTKPYSSIV